MPGMRQKVALPTEEKRKTMSLDAEPACSSGIRLPPYSLPRTPQCTAQHCWMRGAQRQDEHKRSKGHAMATCNDCGAFMERATRGEKTHALAVQHLARALRARPHQRWNTSRGVSSLAGVPPPPPEAVPLPFAAAAAAVARSSLARFPADGVASPSMVVT